MRWGVQWYWDGVKKNIPIIIFTRLVLYWNWETKEGSCDCECETTLSQNCFCFHLGKTNPTFLPILSITDNHPRWNQSHPDTQIPILSPAISRLFKHSHPIANLIILDRLCFLLNPNFSLFWTISPLPLHRSLSIQYQKFYYTIIVHSHINLYPIGSIYIGNRSLAFGSVFPHSTHKIYFWFWFNHISLIISIVPEYHMNDD